ncbi:MAG: HDOD domain-containing protein [Spirochaetes bacterium]|nr:HDOD domain-containing protein [Spirochaetota bacterium]
MSRGMVHSFTIHPPDYMKAINDRGDFFIQFHSFTPEAEGAVIKGIQRYLEHYDLNYIKSQIINIVKELIHNAVKANLKRLYFRLRDLDITRTEDYRAGMETFKQETFNGEGNEYIGMLGRSGMAVRVSFKTTDDYLYVSVINNVPILDAELSKINARIKKAYRYRDITEAFDEVLDESEGAGLGLIMALMIFKNIGMPPGSFRIYRKDDLTIAAIAIPRIMERTRSRVRITEEILREIDDIPAFPENITRIQQLCADPEADIREIADAITMDPGLTTSILRLANSAGYITSKKTETIEEAIKIIGMTGINTLLLATGVHTILDGRYRRAEASWMTSYKRAAYAHTITTDLMKGRGADHAYLGALLADIGYIVMLSLKPKLLRSLQGIAGSKGIKDSNLIEEISLGLSHSALGAMIMRKWKFNETLAQIVEFHHRPHMAPPAIRNTVFIVYLADCMTEIDANRSRHEFIDEEVTAHFKLTDRESFESLHALLRKSFEVPEKNP